MSCDKNKILILIMILLLISLLICVFETLPINRPFVSEGDKSSSSGGSGDGGDGSIGGGGGGEGGGEGGEGSEGGKGINGLIEMHVRGCRLCFDNLTNIPLFEIYGAVKSRYLRVLVGEIYENGVWSILNNSLLSKYNGEEIKQSITNYTSASLVGFQIIPLTIMEGFIPSASNPLRLRLLENKNNLWYYPNQQIFFSEEKIDGDYHVTYMNYFFDEKILALASTLSDPRYLGIPSYMLPALKSLAFEIVEKYGAETTYEKLNAIVDFLRSNYKYDKNYTYPPEGVDPVLWFLFHEKRGICVHFNSAFVLLARSLGIPSRLVGGYLVDSEKDYQVVYRRQSHAYAEVLFEGLGWVIFDATPPECGCDGRTRSIHTTTEIVNLDNTGIKGSTFRVSGQVLDEYGSKVSGLAVKVYLKHNKSENDLGILVGEGFVENGLFNITCVAPLDIDVGDYFVVAHTLTSGAYLGSWSDPQIRIMAKTYLSIKNPEKVIAGRTFVVSGALKEEETNIPIMNETVILTVGSQTYSAITDKDGAFLINCLIEEPGNYTLFFRFDGSKYYLNSTCEKALRVLALEITPTAKNSLIRGESTCIFGRVHAEDLAGDNEEVLISLNEIDIARVRTDSNGYFNITFHVPSNCILGKSILKYLLLCNGYRAIQEVNIMARTRIMASAPSPVESNKPFNVTAILIDDLNQPIQGATIFLNYSCQNNVFSLNSTTDEDGIVLFNVNLSTDKEENVSYILFFAGNEVYLGSQFSGHINVIPGPSPISFLYEIYLLPIALAISFLTYFLYRKGWLRKTTIKPLEEAPKTQEIVTSASSIIAKKNVVLTITFPDIKEPFPLVWGVDEKLVVRLEIREDNGAPIAGASLKLSIDGGDSVHLESSQNGDVETYLTFMKKGNCKLEAYFAGSDQWNEAAAEANIRIVDYREEVIDLFNSFLNFASKIYQGLNDSMTAREIQFKLVSQIPNSKHGYLEDLISIFEVADYSLHTITRKEYERMFLAKFNLER
ncbi:MAG: transglutaminase domain-containing protein [Candidatus Bathyarchaeia archaeon]